MADIHQHSAIIFLLLAVSLTAVCAADADKATEVFESLFGADVARVKKTRDGQDDIDLAKRLLETARQDAAGKPALVTVLCRKAADLAGVHPEGVATAVEAMDLLASSVPEKALGAAEGIVEIRERAYTRARGAHKREAGDALIDALLALADVQAAAREPAKAAATLRRAQAITRATKSDRREEIDTQLQGMVQILKTARKIENMKVLIEESPENTAARERLVRLYLVDLDDPAAAAKYLEGIKDASLKKVRPGGREGRGGGAGTRVHGTGRVVPQPGRGCERRREGGHVRPREGLL